jgi:hypothetical protein
MAKKKSPLASQMMASGQFLVNMKEQKPGYYNNDEVLAQFQKMIEAGILDMFHRTLLLVQLLIENGKLEHPAVPPSPEPSSIILPPSMNKRH